MTTNVLDIGKAILASDSRWSITRQWGTVYVDDTGFDKIELAGAHSFMFAGNGALIQLWKEWLRTSTNTSPEPPVNGIALCIVNVKSVEVVFEYGQDITLETARFAGTGSYPAHTCWNFNRCPLQAVESAKREDKMTGGEVKFVELESGLNNLTNTGTVLTAAKDMSQRGWVMYSNARSSIRVDEAVANDERVKKLMEDVASGAVVATAPCDSMYNKWKDEDKARLSTALDKIFNRRAE